MLIPWRVARCHPGERRDPLFAWCRAIRTFSLDAKNAKEDAKVARKGLYSFAIFASFFATLASEKALPEAVPFEGWMRGAEPLEPFLWTQRTQREDAKVARRALYSFASFASFFATLASEKTLPEAVPFEEWMRGAEPFEPFLWTQRTQREDAKVARKVLYSFAGFASFFATLASEKTLPEAVPLEEWIPAFAGMTSTRAIT